MNKRRLKKAVKKFCCNIKINQNEVKAICKASRGVKESAEQERNRHEENMTAVFFKIRNATFKQRLHYLFTGDL